eukprot:9031905-Lingulodinium_polyedra.AAC.1
MSWRTDNYPGRCAVLCGWMESDRDDVLKAFAEDHVAFQEALAHADKAPLLANVAGVSPFRAVFTAELWA